MSGESWEQRAEKLRARLVERLVADGAIVSDAWWVAFADVPRHLFVPVFYRQSSVESKAVDARTPDEWLEAVYGDELLVVSPDVKSSSTVPSLMAGMLEALDPVEGDRVLEIGTGTGYNAALLCHRLGERNVVSVDIAPDLVEAAGERLGLLGYRPTLRVGDGAEGWAGGAPYDGIIATCAPRCVPTAWVEQTRPGGRIVVPIATGVAVVEVEAGERGVGRFLPGGAFFMPLRPASLPADLGYDVADLVTAEGATRSTELDAGCWFDSDFRFVQSLALPDLRFLMKVVEGGVRIFAQPDGSWARLDGGSVVQGGPVKVWDVLEDVHRQWEELGRPGREKFSLAVGRDGQEVRLEGAALTWRLPVVP